VSGHHRSPCTRSAARHPVLTSVLLPVSCSAPDANTPPPPVCSGAPDASSASAQAPAPKARMWRSCTSYIPWAKLMRSQRALSAWWKTDALWTTEAVRPQGLESAGSASHSSHRHHHQPAIQLGLQTGTNGLCRACQKLGPVPGGRPDQRALRL
jgi:hypothetical protein